MKSIYTATAVLPEWLEADDARLVLGLLIAALALVAIITVILARKAVKFLILTAIVTAITIALATQWVNLRDCYETCDCAVFGADIEIPESVLCGEDRARVGNG